MIVAGRQVRRLNQGSKLEKPPFKRKIKEKCWKVFWKFYKPFIKLKIDAIFKMFDIEESIFQTTETSWKSKKEHLFLSQKKIEDFCLILKNWNTVAL